MTNEMALRSMERSFAETLALVNGIDVDRVSVTLAMEPRDGKEGVRVDVTIDGTPDATAEQMVADWLRVAMETANALAARGVRVEPEPRQ